MTTPEDFIAQATKLVTRSVKNKRDEFETDAEFTAFIEDEATHLANSLSHIANECLTDTKATI